jgi:predicted acetyltransferase
MDVPAALEARTYESDGSIRIGVEDPFRPGTSGVYELAVSDGSGKCVAVDGDADVQFGIDVLGALYLGNGSALSMSAAGLIDAAPDRVSQLHRLFRTAVEPWCNDVF